MGAQRSVDECLAQLDAWAAEKTAGPSAEQLHAFLTHRNSVVVARAASCAARHGHTSLIDTLKGSYKRFCTNGPKTDRRCVAKKAVTKALEALGFDEREWFLDATRCVQHDPSYGGTIDTGAEVRALAVRSLGRFAWFSVARRLVELTGDPAPQVRVAALEVIASFGGSEPALVVLARTMAADPVEEVFGACLRALLATDTEEYLAFVAGYLEDERDGVRADAALALGETRRVEAFDALRRAFDRATAVTEQRVIVLAVSLLRSEEAEAFLREHQDEPGLAETCAEALKQYERG